MYTVTLSDSGKWLLRYEPTGEERSRGALPRPIGAYTSREAATRARQRFVPHIKEEASQP